MRAYAGLCCLCRAPLLVQGSVACVMGDEEMHSKYEPNIERGSQRNEITHPTPDLVRVLLQNWRERRMPRGGKQEAEHHLDHGG